MANDLELTPELVVVDGGEPGAVRKKTTDQVGCCMCTCLTILKCLHCNLCAKRPSSNTSLSCNVAHVCSEWLQNVDKKCSCV